MRDSERKKRTYITVGLCSILMIMVVGFAAFSQQLQINSTSEVTGDWCLGFDNTKTNTLVATTGIQAGTTPTGSMTYGGSTCGTKSQVGVTLASTFKQPGDSIVYTLTILNEGRLDAAIKSVLVDNTSVTSDQTITKGNIKYKIEMPLSTSVAAGGSTTMKVTASFQNDTDITKSFGGDSATIEVKVNAEQDDGNGGFTPTVPAYTGTIYRNNSIVATNNSTSISSWIEGGNVEKWCEVGIYNGGAYNSCEDDNYFNSPNECEDDIAEGISNGWVQQGDLTCQTTTIYDSGYYTKSQVEIQNNYDYYLKHTVVNDIITESYACFVSDTEHCLKGGINECQWDDNANNGNGGCTYSGTPTVFNSNTQVINGYQTYYASLNPICSFDGYNSQCYGGDFNRVIAYSSGWVKIYSSDGHYYCDVDDDGSSECKYDEN